MRTVLHLVLACACALLASCDFPSDPPLKSPGTDAPPDTVADSTDVLLPLKEGNAWIYVATPRLRPMQDPRYAMARPITDDTVTYYEVAYVYFSMQPPSRTTAFPPVLRNTRAGLEFYDKVNEDDTLTFSRPPMHRFTFPYPARAGAQWADPSGETRTMLITTDTLIEDISHAFTWRVYRYDVYSRNQHTSSFFILPGTAIIRIEQKNLVFETVSWRIF